MPYGPEFGVADLLRRLAVVEVMSREAKVLLEDVLDLYSTGAHDPSQLDELDLMVVTLLRLNGRPERAANLAGDLLLADTRRGQPNSAYTTRVQAERIKSIQAMCQRMRRAIVRYM